MAVILEVNYSKKIGLRGYSSHQYMVTLRTEVADLSQVEAESTRLHGILQSSVDREIQKVGYLPAESGNGNGNGHGRQQHNETWNCSPKQRELIEKIVGDHNLEKPTVEALAQDRFGKGVKQLNKLEASGLIEELLEMTGQNKSNGCNRFQRAGSR